MPAEVVAYFLAGNLGAIAHFAADDLVADDLLSKPLAVLFHGNPLGLQRRFELLHRQLVLLADIADRRFQFLLGDLHPQLIGSLANQGFLDQAVERLLPQRQHLFAAGALLLEVLDLPVELVVGDRLIVDDGDDLHDRLFGHSDPDHQQHAAGNGRYYLAHGILPQSFWRSARSPLFSNVQSTSIVACPLSPRSHSR